MGLAGSSAGSHHWRHHFVLGFFQRPEKRRDPATPPGRAIIARLLVDADEA